MGESGHSFERRRASLLGFEKRPAVDLPAVGIGGVDLQVGYDATIVDVAVEAEAAD